MTRLPRSIALAALGLLTLPGCRGVAPYALGVEELGPVELAASLRGARPPLVLDLRDAESYRRGHIPGAVRLGVDQIAGLLHHTPLALRRDLVTVCYHGNLSLGAAATAQAQTRERVRSLRGGMARWIELRQPLEPGGAALDPRLLLPPLVKPSLAAQLAMVGSGFGFKPLYMLLGLVILLWLRRGGGSDLALLRKGMLAFLLGEGICLVNYLFYGESDELDLVHGLGMVAWGALVSWGLFRLLDERVLHLTHPESRCLAQRLCGRCVKQEPVPCPLKRLFLALAPSLAILSLLPWSAPIHRVDLRLEVFGTEVYWFKGVGAQLIEFRLYPLIAAVLLLYATLALLRRERPLERSQGPFFAGLGFLFYSLLRAMLFGLFHRMPAWSSFWEETTELMAVSVIGLLLWVFRGALGLDRSMPRAAGPGTETTTTEEA